jgi:hypothetical protein
MNLVCDAFVALRACTCRYVQAIRESSDVSDKTIANRAGIIRAWKLQATFRAAD